MEIFRFTNVKDIYGAWLCAKNKNKGHLNGALVIRLGSSKNELLERISLLQRECHSSFGGKCDPNCAVNKLKIMVEEL